MFIRHGLIPVNPIDEKFDPNLHEALFQQVRWLLAVTWGIAAHCITCECWVLKVKSWRKTPYSKALLCLRDMFSWSLGQLVMKFPVLKCLNVPGLKLQPLFTWRYSFKKAHALAVSLTQKLNFINTRNTDLCNITLYHFSLYVCDFNVWGAKMEAIYLNVYLFRRCRGKLLVQLW